MFIAFCYQLVIALSKCSFAANNIPPSSLITVFCAWPFFLFFVFIIPHRVFDQNEWRNVYPFTDPCHWAKKFFLSTLPSFAFYPNWNSDALNDLKKKKKKKMISEWFEPHLLGKTLTTFSITTRTYLKYIAPLMSTNLLSICWKENNSCCCCLDCAMEKNIKATYRRLSFHCVRACVCHALRFSTYGWENWNHLIASSAVVVVVPGLIVSHRRLY